MKELVQFALKQRHAMEGGKHELESVLANDHWASELKAMPFHAKVSSITSADFLFRKKAG